MKIIGNFKDFLKNKINEEYRDPYGDEDDDLMVMEPELEEGEEETMLPNPTSSQRMIPSAQAIKPEAQKKELTSQEIDMEVQKLVDAINRTGVEPKVQYQDNKIQYKGHTIEFYSETSSFAIDQKVDFMVKGKKTKLKTSDDVLEVLRDVLKVLNVSVNPSESKMESIKYRNKRR